MTIPGGVTTFPTDRRSRFNRYDRRTDSETVGTGARSDELAALCELKESTHIELENDQSGDYAEEVLDAVAAGVDLDGEDASPPRRLGREVSPRYHDCTAWDMNIGTSGRL